ncbi:ChbG/HpnK family deacetylase [Pseudomonas sp. S 311-6]|uniref:ChbG/HpnK family deacetylase n=1 Tax=Pseudomonas TaxID=286 RepID=UPI002096C2A9|nr:MULTISPECIES: ChbG/HpnK family deacetylase [Pseudomonas]MCO7564134.1 ChbG/HpnK family deacetylase [Pseudomonas mosselii]MCO7618503.1 ChbG/HpnK family deacetylase [Pseudomonas guariconensis]MCO7642681.1 ChbG/HpnK family deacetylase [Pseudomonas sp. S 311-6]
MPSQVIVNADDFGLSAHTNAVILHAFQAGLISSATAMANMPAFAGACVLAQQPALKGRIGLHFNLTYGRPLSQAILAEQRFCAPHGEFDLRLKRRTLRLSRSEREAVEQELQAQWQHCLEHGLVPSHLDSHQHVHNIWPIGEIVARFARQQGVPVRLARNLGHNIGPLKRLFKTLLNRRLRQLSGATADYVCTPVDLKAGLAPKAGVLEVVAHPSALGGHDFGDAYLASGESLKALVDSQLGAVGRIGYQALVPGKKPCPSEVEPA